MTKSKVYHLIEKVLGKPLDEHVRGLREQGMSWHAISIDIADQTGAAVTPETLRIWLAAQPGMERRSKAGAA